MKISKLSQRFAAHFVVQFSPGPAQLKGSSIGRLQPRHWQHWPIPTITGVGVIVGAITTQGVAMFWHCALSTSTQLPQLPLTGTEQNMTGLPQLQQESAGNGVRVEVGVNVGRAVNVGPPGVIVEVGVSVGPPGVIVGVVVAVEAPGISPCG